MKSVILAVSLFLSLSFYSTVSAQLTKMTVGYSAILVRISRRGWLKRREYLPRMVWMCSSSMSEEGPPVMMALLSKETPISQVGGSSIVGASLRGADAVMIAGGNVTADQWLISRPEIKTAEQLKGGSVAIAVFGGTLILSPALP